VITELLRAFFIAAMIIVSIAFIILSIAASIRNVKNALPLLVLTTIIIGFTWALFSLGTM